MSDPRANPLAGNPLTTRDDVARAVIDLYEPLIPHTSESGARVRLGSFAAGFEQASAELEGFARPLYGAIPLTVGGGDFPYWDRFVDGLLGQRRAGESQNRRTCEQHPESPHHTSLQLVFPIGHYHDAYW